jgi:FKBP-type peptidyl-prolyl cis-trans isomerase 2
MQIAKDTVVTLHYEMFDAENNLLDKTEEPIAYLHGGYDGIFPLVEEALHGKNVGDSVDVKLTRMMLSATRKKNWFALKIWTCSRLTWKSA